ncbi:MAG TPA: MlaD family protein [Thermoleophilaceae bacterium]|nr:MlaD family protein [Thermoleophilaceae bacterium]
MDHRVPRVGAWIGLVLALAAMVTFVFLNNRFEGPGDPIKRIGGPTELTATFANTKRLPSKQPVLFKGLEVGRVNRIEWDRRRRDATVTFTLKDDFELRRDAVVRIGERSLIGDPYLDVVTRGSRSLPVLGDGDRVANTKPTVDFDEALDFLDEDGRADVRSVLGTVARGVPASRREPLNDTVGNLSRTIAEARELTSAVRGQEEQIAGLVRSTGVVVDELGRRETSIRTIVGSGRVTLDALASDTRSLERGVAELPALLASGQRSLALARPLVSELRGPVRDLRALSPDLARAFDTGRSHSVRSVSVDLDATLRAMPRLRRVAVPILNKDILPVTRNLTPLVKAVRPPARSLVPALEYLAAGDPGTSRAEAIAGLYASLGAANKGTNGTRGHYSRAGFSLSLPDLLDRPADDCPTSGFCNNAYPSSGDALDPQPFRGSYPRIKECTVPPRSRPTASCK